MTDSEKLSNGPPSELTTTISRIDTSEDISIERLSRYIEPIPPALSRDHAREVVADIVAKMCYKNDFASLTICTVEQIFTGFPDMMNRVFSPQERETINRQIQELATEIELGNISEARKKLSALQKEVEQPHPFATFQGQSYNKFIIYASALRIPADLIDPIINGALLRTYRNQDIIGQTNEDYIRYTNFNILREWRDYLRTEKRELRKGQVHSDSTIDIESFLQRTLIYQIIDSLDPQVSPDEYLIFQLTYIADMKPREITTHMNWPEEDVNRIYSLKRNLFARLRRRLEEMREQGDLE